MRKTLTLPARVVLELAQWGTVAIVVALRWMGVGFATASRALLRHVYYFGIVRLKRRIVGESAWQSHDLSIGIVPPAGYPEHREYEPPSAEQIEEGRQTLKRLSSRMKRLREEHPDDADVAMIADHYESMFKVSTLNVRMTP